MLKKIIYPKRVDKHVICIPEHHWRSQTGRHLHWGCCQLDTEKKDSVGGLHGDRREEQHTLNIYHCLVTSRSEYQTADLLTETNIWPSVWSSYNLQGGESTGEDSREVWVWTASRIAVICFFRSKGTYRDQKDGGFIKPQSPLEAIWNMTSFAKACRRNFTSNSVSKWYCLSKSTRLSQRYCPWEDKQGSSLTSDN